jgi:hypothetical protein
MMVVIVVVQLLLDMLYFLVFELVINHSLKLNVNLEYHDMLPAVNVEHKRNI